LQTVMGKFKNQNKTEKAENPLKSRQN